jgi:prepilin-type processing-associated H-X9-DG protein
MGQPYVGEIRIFAGNFAPANWLFCDGSVLPISEYETLFQLIGTTYGGDGQNTFALPDLRGRIPIHLGAGPGTSNRFLGEPGGVEAVTLDASGLPAHTHGWRASSGPAQATAGPVGSVTASTGSTLLYGSGAPGSQLAPQAVLAAGGNQPHDNVAPYLCVNFIISLFGIFPSPS